MFLLFAVSSADTSRCFVSAKGCRSHQGYLGNYFVLLGKFKKMKKGTLLLLLFFALSLTSCVVTESVGFNANGSGKINYRFDMSKVMTMLGKEMGGMGTELANGKSKDIDTTFTMASVYEMKKDSIAKLPKEQQDKIKKMEKFTCHMVMNDKDGTFVFDLYSDFKNIAEFQEMVSPMNTLSDINPAGNNVASGVMPKNDGVTSYVFDGKKFSKKVSAKSKDEIKSEYVKGLEKEGVNGTEAEALSNQMAQSMEMIYGESDYVMEVSFPKKVKKVSVPNAKISDDKKKVSITYPMKEYMESKNLNFEVELE
ncbi:hypothetical protein FEDK69T_16160 [Flavobacterium enshiense DK69]|nr:hypothetical protein FEDK69T_16160 [Flavobacterium enshiense DK69]